MQQLRYKIQRIKSFYHQAFTPMAAGKRNYAPYTLEELFSITKTGRSTTEPLARQSALEIKWLINEQLLELKPSRILEIGIASGGTTLMLCNVFPEAKVYGLDLTDALISDRLRKHPAFDMTIGNSIDPHVIKLIKSKCSEFDFILVDGDHSESGVISDWKNYEPLLRSGGLLVFHDVRHNPPKGIMDIYYHKIKPELPGSFEYYVKDDNNGYGLWYKP